MRSRAFETRSLPSSLATTHRGFAFYVAFPKSSIRPVGLPIYVARVRSAPFASSSRLYTRFAERLFLFLFATARLFLGPDPTRPAVAL
jgi:hypothetical protein